jgi:hypothetical protein
MPGAGEQAGLWYVDQKIGFSLILRFGISQSNFAKLCLISASPGKYQVEFNRYQSGSSLGSIKVHSYLQVPLKIARKH